MKSHRTSRRFRRKNSYHGRPEALEKRLCLSCTVIQDGANLYITGDNTANDLAAQQDEAGYHVACDGAAMTFRGIERAVIHMGNGDDRVAVAYGTGVYRPADLAVYLGGGNDALDLRADWQNIPNDGDRIMLLDFWAGAGDDRVTAFLPHIEQRLHIHTVLGAGNDTFSGSILPPADVAAAGGGAWTVAVQGQQGDDDMSLMLGAPVAISAPHLINANLDLMLDGGAGADEIHVMLDASVMAAGAELNVGVDGGAGADEVGIIIDYRTAAAAAESIHVDGGSGADTVGIIINFRTAMVDASLDVNVDGGSGDDELTFDGAGSQGPVPHLITGDLNVVLDGGAGNDHELIHAGDNTWAGNVAFTSNGGAGADEIGITFGGTVADGGSLSIGVDSGSGDDLVRGGFSFDPATHGVIAIIFEGASGDDDLSLAISGVGDPNILRAHVDGGPGFDAAHVTRNVVVENCEMVVLV